ncbi:MAG: tRNA (guanosine(37)-N1)-methyltransferase TrmD [Deltaproteobacteria bacterium]|nr:tRNA (guanosine(37)-N1)-methyltransferase TrmD [Deltaproteobacteria bacterium]
MSEDCNLEIDVLSIFPKLFDPFLSESFVGLARKRGLARIEAHDLRRWTTDRHRTVDDSPYGGGPGMLMKPEPLVAGIEALAGEKGDSRSARVVLLSPQGRPLTQQWLAAASRQSHWVVVCGRYEGVDQRVIDLAVDEEVSIGDYVLCGGEVPAMVLIEGMIRLLPGLLGNPESVDQESFARDILEGPQYTRPPEFRGRVVPRELLSGNHAVIERWRRERAIETTRLRRPDLLRDAPAPGEGADRSRD